MKIIVRCAKEQGITEQGVEENRCHSPKSVDLSTLSTHVRDNDDSQPSYERRVKPKVLYASSWTTTIDLSARAKDSGSEWRGVGRSLPPKGQRHGSGDVEYHVLSRLN